MFWCCLSLVKNECYTFGLETPATLSHHHPPLSRRWNDSSQQRQQRWEWERCHFISPREIHKVKMNCNCRKPIVHQRGLALSSAELHRCDSTEAFVIKEALLPWCYPLLCAALVPCLDRLKVRKAQMGNALDLSRSFSPMCATLYLSTPAIYISGRPSLPILSRNHPYCCRHQQEVMLIAFLFVLCLSKSAYHNELGMNGSVFVLSL